MPQYFFDVSGSVQKTDAFGRSVGDRHELRRQALLEAAAACESNARSGDETVITVTVRDLTGAACLKVRLVSQEETP